MIFVLNGQQAYVPDGISLYPITKAEYEALSDQEKNSETAWLITDADANGNVSSGSSCATMEEVNAAIEVAITGAIDEVYYGTENTV